MLANSVGLLGIGYSTLNMMLNDSTPLPPDRHDELDQVVDCPGQPGVGAELLADPDQDQGVEDRRPIQVWHGTPASN